MRLRALFFGALAAAGLAIPVLGEESEAETTSTEVLEPRQQVDMAYGAFQRGYYLTALERALPRAEQGDAAAQTLIAEIFAQGLGVAQNYERAAGWYQLAADNGDVLATFELALLYQRGLGVEQDRQKAADLFRRAAEAGNVEAKYNLALLHVEGLYAEPSLTRAAELLKQAADAGLAEAQYDYGAMLVEGAGLVPNAEAGADYIRKAAEQGLTAAQVDYATMLYLGAGVERDLDGAVNWYQRAAEAGNPVAQNRYAKLLAVGEGVELDLEQAAMWRALARRQGLTDATLDKLLVSIPADALARAEERARYWPAPVPTAESATGQQLEPQDTLPVPTGAGNMLPQSGTPLAPAEEDAGAPPNAEAGSGESQDP
jgi:TPR repeat protein